MILNHGALEAHRGSKWYADKVWTLHVLNHIRNETDFIGLNHYLHSKTARMCAAISTGRLWIILSGTKVPGRGLGWLKLTMKKRLNGRSGQARGSISVLLTVEIPSLATDESTAFTCWLVRNYKKIIEG